MARSTRSFVEGRSRSWPLRNRETVEVDTPAACATSRRVVVPASARVSTAATAPLPEPSSADISSSTQKSPATARPSGPPTSQASPHNDSAMLHECPVKRPAGRWDLLGTAGSLRASVPKEPGPSAHPIIFGTRAPGDPHRLLAWRRPRSREISGSNTPPMAANGRSSRARTGPGPVRPPTGGQACARNRAAAGRPGWERTSLFWQASLAQCC